MDGKSNENESKHHPVMMPVPPGGGHPNAYASYPTPLQPSTSYTNLYTQPHPQHAQARSQQQFSTYPHSYVSAPAAGFVPPSYVSPVAVPEARHLHICRRTVFFALCNPSLSVVCISVPAICCACRVHVLVLCLMRLTSNIVESLH